MRPTGFVLPRNLADLKSLKICDIYEALACHSGRNEMIAADAITCVNEGLMRQGRRKNTRTHLLCQYGKAAGLTCVGICRNITNTIFVITLQSIAYHLKG